MNLATYVQEKLQIRDRIRDALRHAFKERSQRENLVKTEDGSEFGFVLFERETVHRAVNKERGTRNLPPVTVLEVRRVERLAEGHFDYADKFSRYCAELAIGETPTLT